MKLFFSAFFALTMLLGMFLFFAPWTVPGYFEGVIMAGEAFHPGLGFGLWFGPLLGSLAMACGLVQISRI